MVLLPPSARLASSATWTGPASATRKYVLATAAGLLQPDRPCSPMMEPLSALVMKALPASSTLTGAADAAGMATQAAMQAATQAASKGMAGRTAQSNELVCFINVSWNGKNPLRRQAR